ncbi:MAG: hypothetical protein ABI210_07145 [Abditibacteriaceae bacterium]
MMKLNRRMGLATISVMSLFLVASCIKANAASVKSLKWITFLEPVNKALKSDSFEYKDIKGLSGEIAYSYGGIVVRTIKNGVQTKIVTLPIKGGGLIFDIELSPNGRYVLFKAGNYGDDYDTFVLFYWDLKTKQVFQGPPQELTFNGVSWSPSSRYIAYCLGGDVNGDQYGVAGINRPLRLYTFDTKTNQTHFIAEGTDVTQFMWGDGDHLYYPQTKFDRKWVEGGKNDTGEKPLQLDNIYQSSPNGGGGELVLEGANPIAVSPDGTRILLTSYFDPSKPNDKTVKLYPHESAAYPFVSFYDTKQKKLTLATGLDSEFSDVRFLTDDQLLLSAYSYVDTTGTLAVKTFDIGQAKTRDVAQVSEVDSEADPNRASYQPQFSNFALSGSKRNLFFNSWRLGKNLGVQDTGATRYDMPIHLNTVNLETGDSRVVCKTTDWLNFSWGPIFEEVLQQ